MELNIQPPIDPKSLDWSDSKRFDQLFLYLNDGKAATPQNYRYRLTVVDRKLLRNTQVSFGTVVFLIPAGRESEFMFSSHRGLLSIADSAKCGRLIAVSFGRNHEFYDQASVQEELTSVVQILGRQGNFLPSYHKQHAGNAIPFMAIDGIGNRDVLVEGETTLSGGYLVEQVKSDDQIMRRLYFTNNPFVIQSEVRMKSTGTGGSGSDSGTVDVVDKSYLAFEYHKCMVAGLALFCDDAALRSQKDAAPAKSCVIGLGGGGLVNFLQHALPQMQLKAVELDPSVVGIAENYFGLKQRDPSMQVIVGDGLKVASGADGDAKADGDDAQQILFHPNSLAMVAIDVDSKDSTVGMTCPPQAFVSVEYLTTIKSILLDEGSALIVNVSARDKKIAQQVYTNVASVFASVFIIADTDDDDDDDDGGASSERAINIALLATPKTTTIPPQAELRDKIRKVFQTNADSDELTISDDMYSELVSVDITKWDRAEQGKGSNKNKKARNNKKKGKRGKRK